MLTNPLLSLYIHIPWCVQKCPYCDFNSHAQKEPLPEELYISRLIQDLEREVAGVWGRKLHSIFIGGGTPSLFSAQSIDKLLSNVRALIPFESDIEITMEANPGTFEAERFAGFRQAGVNRLSIGVQSFDSRQLKALGRIHNSEQAIAAAEFAHQAGFNSFNLDLMHGLPNQNVKQALTDLETAISLNPQHLSWYQLTIEPNTLFYQQPPQLPVDDILWDIQEQGTALLKQHGYQQYEVSAFAKKPSYRAKHNINYWQFGDYLGIGAGAHGKITRLDLNQIIRTHKSKHPKNYLYSDWDKITTSQPIKASDLPFEFMLNALRLIDGVPQSYYEQRTGLSVQTIREPLTHAIETGLLENNQQLIKPTTKGALFLNQLLEEFMDIHVSKQIISIKSL